MTFWLSVPYLLLPCCSLPLASPWITPQMLLPFTWGSNQVAVRRVGSGLAFIQLLFFFPHPHPHGDEWSWGGGLTTLGLFRLSKPMATPTPNSSSWHVWWATWRMTRQGLLTPSTTKTKHILA